MNKELIKEINNFRKYSGLSNLSESFESHENANELKGYLQGIGYNTKSSMDEAGDLTTTFSDILKKVAKNLKDNLPDIKFTFGSGRDNFHKSYPSSRHNKGNAIDVTFVGGNKSMSQNLDDISRVLCSARENIDGFTFIDEYRHPSAYSTGGHFHLSYSENNRDESSHTGPFCKSSEGSLEFDSSEIEDFNLSISKIKPNPEKLSKVLNMFGLGFIANMDLDKDGKTFAKEVADLFGGGDEKTEDPEKITVGGFKLKDLIQSAKEAIDEDIKRKKKII